MKKKRIAINSQISFSVAIPTYNGAEFIGETLESILEQSYSADEIVIIDDGSTDETTSIVDSIRSNSDKKIVYRKIENSGAGNARKNAIELCSNEWIALCDSDDIWMNDHLERKAEMIHNFQTATILSSDFSAFGPNSEKGYTRFAEAPDGWFDRYSEKSMGMFTKISDPYEAILYFNPLFVSGVVFRKDAYNQAGGIDQQYSREIAEDTDITRKMTGLANANLILDQKITWLYRRHAHNASSIQWKNLLGKADILKSHMNHDKVPKKYIEQVIDEEIRTRKLAFYSAFWSKAFSSAIKIYHTIESRERDTKLITRYLAAKIMNYYTTNK